MENIVVWMAIAFVGGTVFGMTVTANALRGNSPQQPTVVMMEQRRPEALSAPWGGCATSMLLTILLLGAALVILGS